jgi:hypothetical protein
MDNDDLMRFLASWALVHESADEGWKAAVARGRAQSPGVMDETSDAFVDGLAAAVAERTEQLKAELAMGGATGRGGAAGGVDSRAGSQSDIAAHLDELRFEVAELRGRLESMQTSLDKLLARTEHDSSAG